MLSELWSHRLEFLEIISRLISVGFLLCVDPNIMDLLRREHFLRPNMWYLCHVITLMGMIQPCGCLFILAAKWITYYLLPITYYGLPISVNCFSIRPTSTCHIRQFTNYYNESSVHFPTLYRPLVRNVHDSTSYQFISNLARCDRHRLRGYGLRRPLFLVLPKNRPGLIKPGQAA